MKVDGISNKTPMDDEPKGMKHTSSVSPSARSGIGHVKLFDNTPSRQNEINTDIDLTFEKDKWTPCS